MLGLNLEKSVVTLHVTSALRIPYWGDAVHRSFISAVSAFQKFSDTTRKLNVSETVPKIETVPISKH